MVMRSVFDFLAELGVIDIRDVVRDGFIDMCVGFEDLFSSLSFLFLGVEYRLNVVLFIFSFF